MADQWHYKTDDGQGGPISSVQLKQLAECGLLKPSHLVRKDGMKVWAQASKVKGLFGKLPPEQRPSASPIAEPKPTRRADEPNHSNQGSRATILQLESVARQFFDFIGSGSRTSSVSQSSNRELSTVVSYPYADETFPWSKGATLHLVLTPESLLFVERSIFKTASVRLTVPNADLLAIQADFVPMPDDRQSLGEFLSDWWVFGEVEARQIQRHYELVNSVGGPPTLPCVAIQYRDESKYDKKRIFVGIEPANGPGMPLKETVYHLNQLIVVRKSEVRRENENLREICKAGKSHALERKRNIEEFLAAYKRSKNELNPRMTCEACENHLKREMASEDFIQRKLVELREMEPSSESRLAIQTMTQHLDQVRLSIARLKETLHDFRILAEQTTRKVDPNDK
jgi:hypothetical protein